MKTYYHLLINLIAISVAIIWGYEDLRGLALFFLLGTLIDIDHLFFYIFIEERFDVFTAYKVWEEFIHRFNPHEILLVFHNLEFFLIILLVTYLYDAYFILVLTALLIHYFMDILDAIFLTKSKRSWSIIYFFLSKIGKTSQ